MGCGAAFESESISLSSPSPLRKQLLQLVSALPESTTLISSSDCTLLREEVMHNSPLYHCPLLPTLSPQPLYFLNVKLKWKILVYGSDLHLPSYCKCLQSVYPSSECKCVQCIKFIKPSSECKCVQCIQPSSEYKCTHLELPIYPHPCFTQISKDLHRTFTSLNAPLLEKVLQRIANYFPHMGYTQGVNFLVGYFILLNYSEDDCFWLFVHLALNPRFLLLGLYEDGFPLVRVFSNVFRNALRRMHPSLHTHLFSLLEIDDSLWIFKWFMTCFLYSFPLELAKYIIDFIVVVGGIGLVSVALAFTLTLANALLNAQDAADINSLLTELKDIDVFNQNIRLDTLMHEAATIQYTYEDFETQDNDSFYAAFYRLEAEEKYRNSKYSLTHTTLTKLNWWYEDIINKRNAFIDSQGKDKEEKKDKEEYKDDKEYKDKEEYKDNKESKDKEEYKEESNKEQQSPEEAEEFVVREEVPKELKNRRYKTTVDYKANEYLEVEKEHEINVYEHKYEERVKKGEIGDALDSLLDSAFMPKINNFAMNAEVGTDGRKRGLVLVGLSTVKERSVSRESLSFKERKRGEVYSEADRVEQQTDSLDNHSQGEEIYRNSAQEISMEPMAESYGPYPVHSNQQLGSPIELFKKIKRNTGKKETSLSSVHKKPDKKISEMRINKVE